MSIFKTVTVEPALLFYFATYKIMEFINANLLIQKTCRGNITVEPDLNIPCVNETQGRSFATEIDAYYRPIMFQVSIIHTILSTSWSDEGKRRLPSIYLPIVGLILQTASGMVNSYFWKWNSITAASFEMACGMITGGFVLMITSSQLYICDTSTIENRAIKLSFLLIIRNFSENLGTGSAVIMFRAVGFFYSYLICFVMAIASLMLASIFVRDVSVPIENEQHFWHFFNLGRIVDSFRVVFKKKQERNRLIVGILISVYILVFFTTLGEKTVFYSFFKKKFDWDETQFSFYVIYKNSVTTLGTIFCSVVLSKYLKIHDSIIGMLAAFWDTLAVLCYLFANQNWHLYTIPIFEVFHGAALSISISFLSKCYDSNEFGRLNAVLCVFALIIPGCHPSYNLILQKTLDSFPAAFFTLSAFLDVIITILYCILYLLHRKFDKQLKIPDLTRGKELANLEAEIGGSKILRGVEKKCVSLIVACRTNLLKKTLPELQPY